MRRVVLAVLTLVLAVAVGTAGWKYLAAEDDAPRLIVAEIEGAVNVSRGGAPLVNAARGTVLAPGDQVETGAEARAVLQLSPGTKVRLGPTSSVGVVSVDRDGVELELENGLLQATVRPESGAVRVGSRGRQVVATRGEFQVGVNDEILQVAASSGEVSLAGVEPPVVLGAGEQVTVVDRQARRTPIPAEVVLAVAWPAPDHRTRAETQTIEGTTEPGAEVRIEGDFGRRVVHADKAGFFHAEVPLAEGDNRVHIVARDLLGREIDSTGNLPTRDTTGPRVRSE
jgi:ferric-dicitrate binding protein FerR (iron transport regulator)